MFSFPLTVPLPDKKITYKKGPHGTQYVYYTLRAYRNSQGKPTSDEKSIGKLDAKTGRLIPNKNYFDLFSDVENQEHVKAAYELPDQIKNYGLSHVFSEISRESGLTDCLEIAFPESYEKLLTLAMYMASQGNVMAYLDDWQSSTQLSEKAQIHGHHCSEIFASLSFSEQMNFFKNWLERHFDAEYLAYDVTSISSYAQGESDVEWGYNRDKEALPQLNIGMYLGQSTQLPAFFNIYSGSIADKSELPFILAQTKALRMTNISLVLDRGFLTEVNLKELDKQGYPFIIPFINSRKEAQALLKDYREQVKAAVNYIPSCKMYGIKKTISLYGLKLHAHIYFNPKLAFDLEGSIYEQIERYEGEMDKLNHQSLPRRYSSYFDVETAKQEVGYSKSFDKIDEKLKNVGFMIYLTSDETLTPEGLMRHYKQRDCVEKSFDDLKNSLDFQRVKTWTKATTDGKIFVAYLALILRSLIANKLRDNQETGKLTLEKVFLELTKIKEVSYQNERLLMPLTKKQKRILEALKIEI